MFLSRAMPSTIRISSEEFMVSSLFGCYSVVPTNKLCQNFSGRSDQPIKKASQNRRPAVSRIEPVQVGSPAHPGLRTGGAATPAMDPCVCLCKCMGQLAGRRLCLQTQVHPGFSGLEKMDLTEIDVHRRLGIHHQP